MARFVKAQDPLVEFEEVALLGCRAVKSFLLSSTKATNRKDLLSRAKAGAVAMNSYARLRSTMANEEALRMTQERLGGNTVPLRRLKSA